MSVVNFTTQPLYSQERTRYPLNRGLGDLHRNNLLNKKFNNRRNFRTLPIILACGLQIFRIKLNFHYTSMLLHFPAPSFKNSVALRTVNVHPRRRWWSESRISPAIALSILPEHIEFLCSLALKCVASTTINYIKRPVVTLRRDNRWQHVTSVYCFTSQIT